MLIQDNISRFKLFNFVTISKERNVIFFIMFFVNFMLELPFHFLFKFIIECSNISSLLLTEMKEIQEFLAIWPLESLSHLDPEVQYMKVRVKCINERKTRTQRVKKNLKIEKLKH